MNIVHIDLVCPVCSARVGGCRCFHPGKEQRKDKAPCERCRSRRVDEEDRDHVYVRLLEASAKLAQDLGGLSKPPDELLVKYVAEKLPPGKTLTFGSSVAIAGNVAPVQVEEDLAEFRAAVLAVETFEAACAAAREEAKAKPVESPRP